jgi:hypothetical protein
VGVKAAVTRVMIAASANMALRSTMGLFCDSLRVTSICPKFFVLCSKAQPEFRPNVTSVRNSVGCARRAGNQSRGSGGLSLIHHSNLIARITGRSDRLSPGVKTRWRRACAWQ